MGNLDFTNNAGFSWYCIFLVVSGAALLVLGPLKGLPRGAKVANILVGLGFLSYGLFMIFLFHGTSYFVFFKLFILPVLLIVNSFRAARTKPHPQVQPGQMPGQPGQLGTEQPQTQWPVGRP